MKLDWRKRQVLVTAAAVILVLLGIWWLASGPDKVEEEAAPESALFTGEEATAPIKLYFVHADKAGFAAEAGTIYLSESRVARVKQVLQQLFAGPKQAENRAAFPATSAVREVFLDGTGLCVVDLAAATASDFPGGTTAEYQALYTLYRTLRENFSDIDRVQVLVEGKQVESLAGHLDLMDPLSRTYF